MLKILLEKALHSETPRHSKIFMGRSDEISATLDGPGEDPGRGPSVDLRGLASGVVLALSGGPDSAALLALLSSTRPGPDRLVAAHLDHSIRPESHLDAAVAAEQARRAGVPFVTRRIDVVALAGPGRGGLEASARAARYRFLEEVATAEGLPFVATAHHREDQAETVLLRLLRGAGPRGLAAILPSRPLHPGSPVRLVRPVLHWRREDLLARVRPLGWPVATDRTNLDGSNLRSLVRIALLPALAGGRSDVLPRLAALTDAMRMFAGPPDRRPAPTPGFPEDFREAILLCPGRAELPPLAFRCRPSPTRARGREPRLAVLDARRAPPPYVIRFARPGDRFRPLGLGAETTVFRFLLGRRVPAPLRPRTPVLLADRQVAWVVGHRIDERAALVSDTVEAIEIEATPSSGEPRLPPCPPRP
jgi:tRNA(Ile)-lysidine synthase